MNVRNSRINLQKCEAVVNSTIDVARSHQYNNQQGLVARAHRLGNMPVASIITNQEKEGRSMPRKRPIQLVGKQAAFNVEAWARAVEALARQLEQEWKQTGQIAMPTVSTPKPETSS